METEDTYAIFHAIDKVLKPRDIRRQSTVEHYRKKYYQANAQKLKEKRILKG